MSARHRVRSLARKVAGTPDATDVERAIAELWQAITDLRQSVAHIHELAVDDADARRIDDTQRQLDQLQAVMLEHADTLDRIVGHTTDRPAS